MPTQIPLALYTINSRRCYNYDEDEFRPPTPSPIQQGYMNNQYLKAREDQTEVNNSSIVKLPKSNKIYSSDNIFNFKDSKLATDQALTGESSYDQKCCIIL